MYYSLISFRYGIQKPYFASWNKQTKKKKTNKANRTKIIFKWLQCKEPLTSHGILHYLWSVDLSKSFSELIVPIIYFSQSIVFANVYLFLMFFLRFSTVKKCGVVPHCLYPLRKKCPYSKLFWSAFSCIRTECGEIRNIPLYSVLMWGNTDQNNSKTDTFRAVIVVHYL